MSYVALFIRNNFPREAFFCKDYESCAEFIIQRITNDGEKVNEDEVEVLMEDAYYHYDDGTWFIVAPDQY